MSEIKGGGGINVHQWYLEKVKEDVSHFVSPVFSNMFVHCAVY